MNMNAKQNHYDLVITDGRVIDPETGLDAVRNVGITGDKIAAVTDQPIEGNQRIDAAGHVVAPGFIDMHQHNTGIPFGTKLALRDGVTTCLELEAGVYPVDEWYSAVEGKSQANFGASVGTLGIREHILNPGYKTMYSGDFIWDLLADPKDSHSSMSWSTDIATPEQVTRFSELIDEGLSQVRWVLGTRLVTWSTGVRRKNRSLSRRWRANMGGLHSFTRGSPGSCLQPAVYSAFWR